MRNPIFPKVDDTIPGYIREEYQVFHNLIINYFKWLEKDKNFVNVLTRFAEDTDVNNQVKPYIDIIKHELGWRYKAKLKIDDRTLIKLLRDFYLSRGTEQSFKTLFKILFDTNVDISYPRDDLLKLSDNNYIVSHEIITTAINFKNNTDLLNRFSNSSILNITITGLESGLSLIVDKIYPIIKSNEIYLKILVSKTNNDFKPFERVLIYSEGIGSFIEHIFCKLTPLIIFPGHNYSKDEKLIIENPNVPGCEFIAGDIKVESTSLGGITSVGLQHEVINNKKIYYSGLNYKTGDKVTATDRTGKGFAGRVVTTKLRRAEIDLNVINGEILSITIPNDHIGLGYLIAPKITVIDTRIPSRGFGANFICENITTRDYIADCKIAYGGANYSTLPGTSVEVIIDPPEPGGIQATAIAEITDGVISKITITERGSNYVYAPTITVKQGDNTSALVSPILMGSITNIIKLDGGKNYDPNYTEIIFGSPDSSQAWAQKPSCVVSYRNGKINPVLINPGYGYDIVPAFSLINATSGTNFSLTLDVEDKKVKITDFSAGENYIDGISIVIDEPNETGKIEYIDVINPGYDFENFDNIDLSIDSEYGTGAQLYFKSNTIGKIGKIVETESYWIYNTGENQDLTFNWKIKNTAEEESAVISILRSSCINREKRNFENNRGFLEINAFLHDSYFYQQFSYLVNSEYPSKFSKDIIEDLLHPVGFLKFDKFSLDRVINLNNIEYYDIELVNIFDLNSIIDFNAIITFLEIHYFGIYRDALDDIFTGNIEKYIVFSINNILDTMFKSDGSSNLRIYDEKFNMDLEHFKHLKIEDFDYTHPEIIELAALDIELSY